MIKSYIVAYNYDGVVGIHANSDMDMVMKFAKYCHGTCSLFEQAARGIDNVTTLIDLYNVFFSYERINMFCEVDPALIWSDGSLNWIGDDG